jgi:hypothetical protein
LTDFEKRFYLREIKRDITYYSRSFLRAHVLVDIAGCCPDEASRKIKDALTPAPIKDESEASDQRPAGIHPWV